MSEQMRSEFEAWVVDFHRGSSLEGEIHNDERYPALSGQWIYDDWHVQSSWGSWQASRAALCVELPAWEQYDDDMVSGAATAINDCQEAIHAAGVKTK